MSNTGGPEAEPTPAQAPDDTGQATTAGQVSNAGQVTDGEQVIGTDTVSIHRSPRYYRFMIAGGIAGVIVALVLTFAFPEPPGFNLAQIFGFLGILFVIVGVVVGSVVALVLDRASRRRARTIQVERLGSVNDGADNDGADSDVAVSDGAASDGTANDGSQGERPTQGA